MEKKEKICLLILALVTLSVFVINYRIIKKDKSYLRADCSNYYQKSVCLYNALTKDSPYFLSNIKEFARVFLTLPGLMKPPLMMATSLPFYLVFGLSEDTARISNFFYIVILIFSTYLLGKKINSKKTGLISAIIIIFLSLVAGISRTYMVSFASLALTPLTLWLYLKSDYFSNTKFSLLFGLSFASGMLTRYDFFVFVLPWIFIDLRNILRKKEKKKVILNIISSALVSAMIFIPWYFFNTIDILNQIFVLGLSGNYSSTRTAFFYIYSLYKWYFGTFLFPVFLVCFVSFLINKKARYYKNTLFSIFSTFIFYSFFIQNKTITYMMPILPLLVISSVSGNINISKKIKIQKIARLAQFILLVFALIQFSFDHHMFNFNEDKVYDPHLILINPDTQKGFEYENILDYFTIINTSQKTLLIINHRHFSPLHHFVDEKRIDIMIDAPMPPLFGGYISHIDVEKTITDADFVFTTDEEKDYSLIEENNLEESLPYLKDLYLEFYKKSDEFDLVLSFYSNAIKRNAYLYKRKN